MPYLVRYEPEALEDLDDLPINIQRQIIKKIDWLGKNGDTTRHRRLTGKLAGFYKLRLDDYRSIYELNNTKKQIIIIRIGHRRNIYR